MDVITLEKLAAEVAHMREAQKEYFKYRNPSALNKSKLLESKVDAMLKNINWPKPPSTEQSKLF